MAIPYVDSVVHLDRRTVHRIAAGVARVARGAVRFRGRFSGPGKVGAGGYAGAPRTHFRIQCRVRARIARRPGFTPPKCPSVRITQWTGTWISRPRREPPTFCARSRCRLARRKPNCRKTISCSRARWPDGAPSSGRSNTMSNWLNDCAASAGCPWWWTRLIRSISSRPKDMSPDCPA